MASRPVGPAGRPVRAWLALTVTALCLLVVLGAGCAKYNTYYNAKRAFDQAEYARAEAIKTGTDAPTASLGQRQNYMKAVDKAKKLLRDYPGHDLTDDALYLLGKSYQRMASYRESIRRLDQLFVNFPSTEFLEEAIFLQAVNYLMLGNASRSQEYLDRLATQFPDSEFQSEALRSSGDNAFALEGWEDAASAYSQFLEQFPEADNWDDSSLHLAESLWELERYDEAVVILEDVNQRSDMADRVFRARLLEARCRVRLGQYEDADVLVTELKDEAQIYSLQGDVTLVEAQNLLAQGELEAGMAMLQGMPEEHVTRDVKPVRADLLGYAFMDKGELEQAKDNFQQAVGGGDLLDDVDGTRLLLDTIKDYLAAEGQLPDAAPPRAASLRLIKANALLFGFERPQAALDLYAAVAADTAADSTVAPRALYGAMMVHENWLGHADSAAIYRGELMERFPESAHAYQANAGLSSDLLAYLLERDEVRLAAARTDSSLADDLMAASAEGGRVRGRGLRRRLVYLQLRSNLVYPPPEAALLALEAEQAARATADSLALAAADSVSQEPAERPAFDLLPEHLRPVAQDTVAVPVVLDSLGVPVPVPVDSLVTPDAAASTPEPEKKKKKASSWDL